MPEVVEEGRWVERRYLRPVSLIRWRLLEEKAYGQWGYDRSWDDSLHRSFSSHRSGSFLPG